MRPICEGLSQERKAEFLESRLRCPLCRHRLHSDAEGWRCEACARFFPRVGDHVNFLDALPPDWRDKVETDFSEHHYALPDEPYWKALVAVTQEYSTRLAGILADLTVSPRRCLDIGRSLVADGRIKPHLLAYERSLSVYCVLDPDPGQLECRDDRIFVARSVGEVLPFADASFEIVLIHASLDHCFDYSRALDECERVLVPGGVLSIGLNNDGSWVKRLLKQQARRRRVQASQHHNVFFSATRMLKELRGRGYSIVHFRGLRYLLLPASVLNGMHRTVGPGPLANLMRLADRVGNALAPRLGGDFHVLARKGAHDGRAVRG